jgi:hypothetical protein
MSNSEMLSRRTLLTVAVGAATALVVADAANAGTIPQTAVAYQKEPKDGHNCAGCKLFVPGASADAAGTCKSVAGEILPNGWCKLWAAKAA